MKKEHFYKLENVIILLDSPSLETGCNRFVKILQKNVQVLKYQFKQFIIGIKDHLRAHCYVLEWNKNIDTKYLHGLNALCNEICGKQEIQKQMHMQEKYSFLLESGQVKVEMRRGRQFEC